MACAALVAAAASLSVAMAESQAPAPALYACWNYVYFAFYLRVMDQSSNKIE